MITHNALALTNRTIKSIMGQDLPIHLFVVDNCSTDQTVEHLDGLGIQTLASKFNMGVSKAWNYGLGYFFQTGYDHVLVVNNDIEMQPETYRELLADGGDFVTGVGVNTWDQAKQPFIKSVSPHPDFSCFLIRRSVWDKIGSFDEEMFLYASDADYHVRMHQAGIEAYTIGLPFYHVASGTIKTNPEEASLMHQRANLDRAVFKAKWGCEIGTHEYYNLFK